MAVTDYIDIDIDGEETDAGIAKTYLGDAAVKNAFKNYLSSEPGEILYYPYNTGSITQLLGKSMNETQLADIQQAILRAIANDFPMVTVTGLSFIPDYENGILQLDISYTIEGTSSVVSVYYDKQLTQTNYNYIQISYIEENLKNFCIELKPSMTGIQLGLDGTLGKFRWGDYVFTNFFITDPYFEEIFTICNS